MWFWFCDIPVWWGFFSSSSSFLFPTEERVSHPLVVSFLRRFDIIWIWYFPFTMICPASARFRLYQTFQTGNCSISSLCFWYCPGENHVRIMCQILQFDTCMVVMLMLIKIHCIVLYWLNPLLIRTHFTEKVVSVSIVETQTVEMIKKLKIPN